MTDALPETGAGTALAVPAPSGDSPVAVDAGAVTQTVSALAVSALDHWFHLHIPNSVVSRNTEIFNRVLSAVTDIKTAIALIKE